MWVTWTGDQSSSYRTSLSDEGESGRSLMSSYKASENGGIGSANGSAASLQVTFFIISQFALSAFVVCNIIDCHDWLGGFMWGQSVGRNNPCPCGSKRKYKSCCGTSRTRMTLAYMSRFAFITSEHLFLKLPVEEREFAKMNKDVFVCLRVVGTEMFLGGVLLWRAEESLSEKLRRQKHRLTKGLHHTSDEEALRAPDMGALCIWGNFATIFSNSCIVRRIQITFKAFIDSIVARIAEKALIYAFGVYL